MAHCLLLYIRKQDWKAGKNWLCRLIRQYREVSGEEGGDKRIELNLESG